MSCGVIVSRGDCCGVIVSGVNVRGVNVAKPPYAMVSGRTRLRNIWISLIEIFISYAYVKSLR